MEKFHNDILFGENSYYNVDHQTSERDLSYFIFFSEEMPLQKPINTTLPGLMTQKDVLPFLQAYRPGS